MVAQVRRGRSAAAEVECTRQPHQRHICGWDNNLWQGRTRPFEDAHATGLDASDRTLSPRSVHRRPSAWIEPELAEWRYHHAEQGGRHESISCLLHQQSNSNCYRFFRMSLKYMYSSLARAEPTHRCASNAPISPAHVRICHKTKASKRNFLLHPLKGPFS